MRKSFRVVPTLLITLDGDKSKLKIIHFNLGREFTGGSYHLNVSSQSSLQRFGILTSCYKILSSHPQKCSRSIFILTLNFSVFPKPPSNVTVQSIQNWLKSASKQVEVKHKCCKFPHPQSQFILILPVFISSYLSV